MQFKRDDHLGTMGTDMDMDTGTDSDTDADTGYDICEKIRIRTRQGHGKTSNIIYILLLLT